MNSNKCERKITTVGYLRESMKEFLKSATKQIFDPGQVLFGLILYNYDADAFVANTMDEFIVVIDGIEYDIPFFIRQILVLFIFVAFYILMYEKRLTDASNNIVLILIVIDAFLTVSSKTIINNAFDNNNNNNNHLRPYGNSPIPSTSASTMNMNMNMDPNSNATDNERQNYIYCSDEIESLCKQEDWSEIIDRFSPEIAMPIQVYVDNNVDSVVGNGNNDNNSNDQQGGNYIFGASSSRKKHVYERIYHDITRYGDLAIYTSLTFETMVKLVRYIGVLIDDNDN